ncbi:MAG: hypothetical protein KJ646_02020 [Nanoarchaeota archaeon]|nr:hypothetical protein [Nanoarchaeota archaeon]MBU4116861.1 hypothetical protein [Nanoarchaeota archaeon]
MALIEEIMQMKNNGMQNREIAMSLQEKGISPREINDALSQAQIKSAVSDQNGEDAYNIETPMPNSQEIYSPQTMEIPEETYAPQQEYAPQDSYNEYSAQPANDTELIVDIAEQVFSEKMKKIEEQVNQVNQFKTIAQLQIQNNLERIKRIEAIIDKLQISILEKISSYGTNIEGIKKEMSMMQDSFGKVINPLLSSKHTIHKKISKK